MSKMVKVAGLVLTGVAVLAVTLFAVPAAMAQEPDPTPIPWGPRGFGGRGVMSGGYGLMAPYQDVMHTAIAEALGLTVEEFNAALAEGKTLWQIAEEQGVSLEEVTAAKLEARADVLAQMVADGVITQEQADWMLSRMQAGGAYQGGFGPGMMGGRGAGRSWGGQGGRGPGFEDCPYYPGGPTS